MINLLTPTKGGSVEKVIGLFICLIIIGLLCYFQYKKCDRIIKSRYSSGLIISYSVASIFAMIFVILGSHIMLTTEPNIGLIVVAVFMVLIPSVGTVYLAFVPILSIIKTALRQLRFNLVAMIFSCLSILSCITCLIMIFLVF